MVSQIIVDNVIEIELSIEIFVILNGGTYGLPPGRNTDYWTRDQNRVKPRYNVNKYVWAFSTDNRDCSNRGAKKRKLKYNIVEYYLT